MSTPEWVKNENIKISLDARPLLAQGIHPLEQVQKESAALNQGELFEIITPFLPSPMIEKMTALGFDAYTEAQEDSMFHTFFLKK